MSRCEDYPCCGHTNDDPCERQPYDEPGYFDTTVNPHALCDHEYGDCNVEYDDEPDGCDPANDYCENDNDDCEDCAAYWLEFHAEGAREDFDLNEDAAMEFGLWGSEA